MPSNYIVRHGAKFTAHNSRHGNSSMDAQLAKRKLSALKAGWTNFDFDGDTYVLWEGKFVAWWAVKVNDAR